MARKADDPKAAAVQGVDERAKELQEAQKAAQKVMDESKPTPTQRENDLAKVGALDIDDKEADGSEEQASPAPARASSSEGGTSTYRNRAAKSE
jgi:hypothetical protein